MSAQDRASKSQSPTQSPTRAIQRRGPEEELSALGAQRARHAPHTLTPNEVAQLQRTIGNRAVGQLLEQGPENIQRQSDESAELEDNPGQKDEEGAIA